MISPKLRNPLTISFENLKRGYSRNGELKREIQDQSGIRDKYHPGSQSIGPANTKPHWISLSMPLVTHFTVYTDNNPLTYVLTTAKLSATGHR